jgi:hypothetical protein
MDINNLLGNHRKPECSFALLSDDDVLVKEKVKVADMFNEYFTLVGKELAAGLDDVSNSGVVYDRNLNSIFFYLKLMVLLDTIKCLFRALKASKHEIIPYLFHSINCSMNSGIYPDCLKMAMVRPLHKLGNKRHVGNYRSISVPSPVKKKIEKVIYHR